MISKEQIEKILAYSYKGDEILEYINNVESYRDYYEKLMLQGLYHSNGLARQFMIAFDILVKNACPHTESYASDCNGYLKDGECKKCWKRFFDKELEEYKTKESTK